MKVIWRSVWVRVRMGGMVIDMGWRKRRGRMECMENGERKQGKEKMGWKGSNRR